MSQRYTDHDLLPPDDDPLAATADEAPALADEERLVIEELLDAFSGSELVVPPRGCLHPERHAEHHFPGPWTSEVICWICQAAEISTQDWWTWR
jgi:hypothetical protein